MALGASVLAGCGKGEPRRTADPSVQSTGTAAIGGPFQLSAFDPRIRGWTGSPGAIASIAKAYRVYYKRVPLENGDFVMDHSTMVYMMDARGRFVGPIGNGEPNAQVMPLLRDLVARRTPVSHAPDPNTAIERSRS